MNSKNERKKRLKTGEKLEKKRFPWRKNGFPGEPVGKRRKTGESTRARIDGEEGKRKERRRTDEGTNLSQIRLVDLAKPFASWGLHANRGGCGGPRLPSPLRMPLTDGGHSRTITDASKRQASWLQSPAPPLPRLHARSACRWTLLRFRPMVASSHRADDCVLCARCATDHRTLNLKFDGCARSSHCVLAGRPWPSPDRTFAKPLILFCEMLLSCRWAQTSCGLTIRFGVEARQPFCREQPGCAAYPVAPRGASPIHAGYILLVRRWAGECLRT